MTQTLSKYKRYVSDFHAFQKEQTDTSPEWVRRIRDHALERFSELGFPTARRANEKWKYTNVGPIANTVFRHPVEVDGVDLDGPRIRQLAPWDDGWVNLVFLDGRYSRALSTIPRPSNGVHVASLAEAMVSDQDVVVKHLSHYASVEEDGFAALNTAFVGDGAYVHIPEGTALDAPIHLVFISTDRKDPTVSHPRVLVVADAESKSTIIESYVGLSDSPYFTNSVSEMVLGEGAAIRHYRLLAESDKAFHVGVARVHQSENSVFSSGAFEMGAALGRYDLYVHLDGPGSSCGLNGLYMTTGTQHMDNFINIDHARPHTTSRLYYKGILGGKSRAIFGGTVLVRKDAQKADASQSDKNLVLSPNAEVDSKPALFIYADDVKCGHGATAGNIDQDTVFYMRSRGVDLDTASKLLIYGFASEIIDSVVEDAFRAYLEKLFLESLPTYRFEF